MATYIATLKFTSQGLQAIKDSPKRANAFKAAGKKLGIKVLNSYWTMGAFDGVLIFQAADDETAAAAVFQLSSQGNVTTTTSRAFDAAEIGPVLEKL